MKIEELNIGDLVWTVPYLQTRPIQLEIQKLLPEDGDGPAVMGIDITNRRFTVALVANLADTKKEAKAISVKNKKDN